ncbi:MAG: hypothetical protein OHK0053_00560 [Microscillaceae bacterium]
MSNNFIENILLSHPEQFGPLSQNPQKFEIQVLYTQIDRDAQNRPHFKTFAYNVDKHRYFYPASVVKLPVALLAMEKLNLLQISGLDKYTRMEVKAARPPQTEALSDSTAPEYKPTIAHYIKKIFVVSDNDAYNRLFEFLGPRYINETLHKKGYTEARIVRRLAVRGFDEEANRYTNPVQFKIGDQVIYEQEEQYNSTDFPFPAIPSQKGKAYIDAKGKKVNQPFDFAGNNYLSLETMHEMLRAVIFPLDVSAQKRFNLNLNDYQFLYRCMGMWPRESRFPEYKEKKYQDGYSKYLLFGNTQEKAPDHIRIFNKVGLAYGFLIENAYVIDFEAKTEFLLSAVIHVNENETYNDDRYEYEALGFPFFVHLGRHLAEHEKKRPRAYLPNLERFDLFYRE